MWRTYLVACILLTSIFPYIGTTTDQPNTETNRQFSPCDRDIVKVMCNDFKEKIAECAGNMPPDEEPFWHDCAVELEISNERKWISMLDTICKEGDNAVEMAWNCSICWSRKMQENIGKMKDDWYPTDYFDCSERIFKGAVEKTDCACQLEKRPTELCSSAPKPESANPFGK